MVSFQHFLRFQNIHIVLRPFIPRKLQQRFNIPPFHRAFRTVLGQSAVTGDFFLNLLLYFFFRLQLAKLFLELLRVRKRIVLPQLLTDKLELLPQKIFLLVLFHPSSYLFGKFRFNLRYFRLAVQYPGQHFITLFQVYCGKHCLLVFIIQGHIDRHLIQQAA